MKRLFMLRQRKRGPALTGHERPVYFEDKMEAKEARNYYREHGHPDCVVSFGPDHIRYKGE